MRKEENILKNLFSNFSHIKTDRFFFQVTAVLALAGLIFAFSSSTYQSYALTKNFFLLGLKQLTAFLIGFVLLIYLSKVNHKVWYKITWPFSLVILFVMLITVCSGLGKTSGGSQRWIDIGFFQFQPAELAKFSVILLISSFLTKYRWSDFKHYYYFAVIGILILIILKQPDLGSASILVLLILQLFFIFMWPLWILLPGMFLAVFIGYLKALSTPYQLDRIKFWLNPYLEPQGRGYNLIQAKIAYGLGALWGSGLGNSVQKQGHLPVPHSDFIFAVIAEETGLLGVTAILILYITWILRGLFLINKVQNKYSRILGTAIIIQIGTQAVINIAVSCGILPVTGVTLPFFSCGGTSLIVTLGMCGILFNVISESETQKQ